MSKLSAEEIGARAAEAPGWTVAGDALAKTYTFPTFPAGIAFVDQVAQMAEEMGHHPDITINYTRVTFTLSTHDQGGVTEKDFALAKRIEAIPHG